MLTFDFFNRNTIEVAKDLLGKIIFHKYKDIWLKAMIIETEAYLLEEKGSHASLGFSDKKKALFMPPGSIYMYYARGKDSFNISTGNPGDAVLIKSGIPYLQEEPNDNMLGIMKKFNLINNRERATEKLCSGQTLVAKSLNLKVNEWDQKQFDINKLFIKDVGYKPMEIVTAKRLGIPKGRDEDLMYRFIDGKYLGFCTRNPIPKMSK